VPPLEKVEGVTWVRIDDGFTQHPKVVAAGPLAMAMQVAALCYCNKNLTDGFIPRAVAKTLLDWELDNDGAYWTISVATDDGRSETLAPEFVWDCLLAAGLWERVPGGFRIHDYLEYQPSKEDVLALRDVRAEAGRLGGLKRAENQANEANAKQSASNQSSKIQANAKQNSSPYPYPVPEPLDGDTNVSLAGSRQRYSDEFQDFWKAYGPTNGPKKPAFVAWQRLSRADRLEAVAGLGKWLASDKWRQGFKDYPQKYLSQRFWENDPVPDQRMNGSAPPVDQAKLAEIDSRLAALSYQGVVEEIPRP
jgi:hypothetical protein